jgi:hypothetical protein
MTHRYDIDDVLREWADEGDERMPFHNLQAALAAIETTPQRGARPALLEGILMRIQPFAIPMAVVATLVLAVVAYALVSRPPSVGPEGSPSPAATQVSGELQTATFNVPVTIQLQAAPDPDGWYVRETASALTISPTETDGGRLVILDAGNTSMVDADGAPEPLTDDLVGALNAQAGVTAEEQQAPDLEGPASYLVAGEEVTVVRVTVDGSASGRPLIRTPDGVELSTSADSPWWILRAQPEGRDLLVILPAAGTPDATFSASYLGMLESMAIR